MWLISPVAVLCSVGAERSQPKDTVLDQVLYMCSEPSLVLTHLRPP